MAIYGVAKDYELNKARGKDVQLFEPGKTQLADGDVFLGGPGTGVTDDMLGKGVRVFGDTAEKTSLALDNYEKDKSGTDLASQLKTVIAANAAPRVDANRGMPTLARQNMENGQVQSAITNALNQKTFDHGVAQDNFQNEYNVGNLLGNYKGQDTLSKQAQAIQDAQYKMGLAQDESQFGRTLGYNYSNSAANRKIDQQKADYETGVSNVTYSAIPENFWKEATAIGGSYGTDPLLLAAIAKHETTFGTEGAGRDGFALGVGVYDSGNPNSNYQDSAGDYTKQLTWAANSLANNFSGPVTEESIKAYQNASGYATDPDWAKGVYRNYLELKNSKKASAVKPPSAAEINDAKTSAAYADIQTALNNGVDPETVKQNILSHSADYSPFVNPSTLVSNVDDIVKSWGDSGVNPATIPSASASAAAAWNSLNKIKPGGYGSVSTSNW